MKMLERPAAGVLTPDLDSEMRSRVARAVDQLVCNWRALQDSNLRPLPCESARGSRQTYASLINASQSLEIMKRPHSDLRHDLALVFPRAGSKLGPMFEL